MQIKIGKNISGEHNLSPENRVSLQYFEGLSLDSQGLSQEQTGVLSTKSAETGDSGITRDNSSMVCSILVFVLIVLYINGNKLKDLMRL